MIIPLINFKRDSFPVLTQNQVCSLALKVDRAASCSCRGPTGGGLQEGAWRQSSILYIFVTKYKLEYFTMQRLYLSWRRIYFFTLRLIRGEGLMQIWRESIQPLGGHGRPLRSRASWDPRGQPALLNLI